MNVMNKIATIPFVMTSLGADDELGNNPSGCPEFKTNVCSSDISLKYFITNQNWETNVIEITFKLS